jgi:cellulose synthase/poly-beta-1,6-N-acetylglucosamine synthase-like glycosyltransferase
MVVLLAAKVCLFAMESTMKSTSAIQSLPATPVEKRPDPRKSREELPLIREIHITYLGLAVTGAASALFVRHIWLNIEGLLQDGGLLSGIEQVIFLGIVFSLVYGNLVYQFARLGHLKRHMAHRPAPRGDLEAIYDRPAPTLVILIPSYKENPRVVKQTLLSAALQEYPNRRVVLLIDDPPNPTDPGDAVGLFAARRLPREVQAILEPEAVKLESALRNFLSRRAKNEIDRRGETRKIAELYRQVSSWITEQVAGYPVADHTDAMFVQKILLELDRAHLQRCRELQALAEGSPLGEKEILREYRRLASLFRVELSCFERKRYVNLSHEPNKAMNLNSYIGLMGESFHEVPRAEGLFLEQAPPGIGDLHFPDADYLIMLDADSLLMHDYALRLIHIMESPGNERLAIAQTPYSAVPGAPGVLERIAGATTDIQYYVHQGFTRFQATYWVGANALARKSALDDICLKENERGYPIAKYIQDRTHIEDTESSIDLVDRGWRLYNYPARLAYSATPCDFGALLIQRRRWANGGLIILPKLLRCLFRGPKKRSKLAPGLMRLHYLLSLSLGSAGIMLILAYPFENNMFTLWLPLTALPYFLLYGRDLARAGYRMGDVVRVYALNMMLIPVHLGGVFKSLHQACTGKKTPFRRTPKRRNRTASPPLYVLAEYAILLLCGVSSLIDFACGRWIHGICALGNAGIFVYILTCFIGWRAGREDLFQLFRKLFPQPPGVRGKKSPVGV